MNNFAIVNPPSPIAMPVFRNDFFARAPSTERDHVHADYATPRPHLAMILDSIDCGILVCAGHEVLYHNRAAGVAMQSSLSNRSGGPRQSSIRVDIAAVIDEALDHAGQLAPARLVSLHGGDDPLTAAAVPLMRRGGHGRDLVLVVLGSRRACEDLSAHAGGVLSEIEELLLGIGAGQPNRALMTMLFTDIVDSTRWAEELGDEQWRRLLERHHVVVRRQLAMFRGREIDTAGDGFFATFDAPARAVRCAQAIRSAVHAIGLEIRAGLHTGECEILASKVSGVAVHVAARVAAAAAAGEILVSGTLRDLVAGSGLNFSGGDGHVLKGLSGEWRLFAVCGTAA